MATLLLSHPASLDHLVTPGHPERPDRIRAVNEVLGYTILGQPATQYRLDVAAAPER